MAIDPTIWANTPGMGRAPLLPTPTPDPVVTDPRADLARRLMGTVEDTRVTDRPIGAVVRNPAGMTQGQQIAEMMALGGFPSEGAGMAARGPATAVGTLASLGSGLPGLGVAAGQMAKAGIQARQKALAGELTQGMAEAMERGTQARDQRDLVSQSTAFADAYEAGRQAAVRDTGSHQQDRSSRASAGLTGGFDPETGFGGA